MIKKKFQKTFLGYVCPYNKEILKKISINGNFFLRSYKNKYPIINEIPRFVELKNYANDFGFQWKKFRKTQLDSFSGLTISEERLKRVLNMPLKDLKNKKVLEAGCGSGRFSEILLKYGAVLTSFDFSDCPFAFLGHSMGAIVAYETARRLRAIGADQPVHLFLSARAAPHLQDESNPLRFLDDETFIDQLHQTYGAVPEAIQHSKKL